MRIAIVGASISGVNAADAIRAEAHDAEVVLFDKSVSMPYDRPALSKGFLSSDPDLDIVSLRDDGHFAKNRYSLRLASEVVHLDRDSLSLTLADGVPTAPFDALILATGCRANVPFHDYQKMNAHMLRTDEDAARLRLELRSDRRIVIIGGGFVGLEVAAIAALRGMQVTVIHRSPLPLAHVLGDGAAEWLIARHRRAGVRFVHGTALSLDHIGGQFAVNLADSSTVPYDVAVIGVGVSPDTDWLRGSGVHTADGVVCDRYLSSTRPGVFAAGDVASWSRDDRNHAVRIEHFDTAGRQGAVAGRNAVRWLLGASMEEFSTVPYLWSDQFDLKIQVVGTVESYAVARVMASSASSLIVEYRSKAGERVAFVGVNAPARVMKARRAMGVDFAS